MQLIIALAAGAALVASILVVVPYLSLDASTPDTPKRVFALDPAVYYGSVSEGQVSMRQ